MTGPFQSVEVNAEKGAFEPHQRPHRLFLKSSACWVSAPRATKSMVPACIRPNLLFSVYRIWPRMGATE
eukprot:5296135-Karenia_brevis.AAC.1